MGLARYTAASSYPEQKGASHVSPSQLLVHTLNRKGLHMWVHLDSPASRNQECDDIRFFRMHVLGGYYPSRSSGRRSHSLLPTAPIVYFFPILMPNEYGIYTSYIHTLGPLSFSHLFSRPSRPWLSPSSLPPTAFSFLYSSLLPDSMA